MLKTALGVSLGALALAYAPTAGATTFHVGDLPNFYLTSGTPTSPSITANFGNGFNGPVMFDDSFEFTIPQNGVGSGSISTSFSSAANHLVISGLWINGVAYVVPATATGQSLTIGGIPIISGLLNTIRVTGTSGSAGGSYDGTATFSASAVPEPATWALMLGGFGLVGAMTRRRSKTTVTYA